jgi:hypothetical protein
MSAGFSRATNAECVCAEIALEQRDQIMIWFNLIRLTSDQSMS